MYDTVCPVGWIPECQRLLDYVVYLYFNAARCGTRLGICFINPKSSSTSPTPVGGRDKRPTPSVSIALLSTLSCR